MAEVISLSFSLMDRSRLATEIFGVAWFEGLTIARRRRPSAVL